jgi:hypothetical protein
MDRTCCVKNDTLHDPAGVVEGKKYGRTAQHEKVLPGQGVAMAMRPYVSARLDGDAETLDRVCEISMEIVMGPFPRGIRRLQ